MIKDLQKNLCELKTLSFEEHPSTQSFLHRQSAGEDNASSRAAHTADSPASVRFEPQPLGLPKDRTQTQGLWNKILQSLGRLRRMPNAEEPNHSQTLELRPS